jgi:hypothetical protein
MAKKLIRATYPAEFSIGILILIFVISGLLSHQIFEVPFHELEDNKSVYFGMLLVGIAVVITLLILWEEILFPIKIKQVPGGMVFRNHGSKLKTQLLIYLSIPAIFGFIYLEYDVNHLRFIIWASVCIGAPILEKIASGINNYNDFLELTNEKIEYKDNEKEGSFETKNIRNITIIKDERDIIAKIQLLFTNNNNVTIDLDQMELDAFYDSIYNFITTNYKHLLKETNAA